MTPETTTGQEGAPNGAADISPSTAFVPRAGPILISRGCADGCHHVDAMVVRPAGEAAPPPIAIENGPSVAPQRLRELSGAGFWRYRLSFPAEDPASYDFEGERFRVAPIGRPDLRIAYVSCNGQEKHDLDRPMEEREVMWNRLAAAHEERPFALMLEGGDQLYADDVKFCHPLVEAWDEKPEDERGAMPLPADVAATIRSFYLERYCRTYTRPAMRRLSAEVPAAMMWDDHDIIDGWGSHPPAVLDGPIGRGIFEAARDFFLLIQLAASDDDLPSIFPDRTGEGLGYVLRFPDFSVVVPDLRSERRLERVMGPKGWAALETMFADTPAGQRIILMSSVPVMGPRLSWVEAVIDYVPPGRAYEDDLRDQWQSRSHREEWIRLLKLLASVQEGGNPITIVSGEIHLATRGEMVLHDGSVMHQLVSSGISHRAPPKAWAYVLTMLARFGESPLPRRKIRLHRLPEVKTIYVEERNYMILTKVGDDWSARWSLEDQGDTGVLAI